MDQGLDAYQFYCAGMLFLKASYANPLVHNKMFINPQTNRLTQLGSNTILAESMVITSKSFEEI